MNFIRHLFTQDIRVLCLSTSLIIYALFGLPTPDNPGIVELAIGFLLICAVGFSGLSKALMFNAGNRFWFALGQMVFIYGLVVSPLAGLFFHHGLGHMVRDILPFMFLLMPVLFTPYFQKQDDIAYNVKALKNLMIFLGSAFAIRAIFEHISQMFDVILIGRSGSELTYLANAPTILFASIMLFGASVHTLIQKALSIRTLCIALGLMALGLITLTPMALTIQRASLLYCVLSMVFIFLFYLRQAPLKTIILACLLFVFFYVFAVQLVLDLSALLWAKTRAVGINMRFAELKAIWSQIDEHPLTLLLGMGWGAGFKSPAVGEVYVYYSHSLLSSALLKNGIIGLLLVGTYISSLVYGLLRHFKTHPLLCIALLGPIFIDVFFYASFKSLDFGLILLLSALVPLYAQACAQLQNR